MALRAEWQPLAAVRRLPRKKLAFSWMWAVDEWTSMYACMWVTHTFLLFHSLCSYFEQFVVYELRIVFNHELFLKKASYDVNCSRLVSYWKLWLCAWCASSENRVSTRLVFMKYFKKQWSLCVSVSDTVCFFLWPSSTTIGHCDN